MECVARGGGDSRRRHAKKKDGDFAVSAAVFKINSPGSTCQRLRATRKRQMNMTK